MLNSSMDPIFMIRNGGFGSNFETKLYMTILGLIWCIFDFHFKKRNDYLYIFLTGSIIWTLVEFSLQSTGTRDIEQVFLFGWNLPLLIASLLQGTSEAAVIALIGISFGDYFSDKITRKFAFLGFILLMGWMMGTIFRNRLPSKNIGGDVVSRRDIFSPAALLFLGLMILIDIVWYWKASPLERRRSCRMLMVLILFSSLWTIIEWASNTRWIEVKINSSWVQASPAVTLFALGWDILVEIGLAYLPYYAIPALLGVIPQEKG